MSLVAREWVELVDDLMVGTGPEFPHDPVLRLLEKSFDARASYMCEAVAGYPEFWYVDAPPDWPPEDYVDRWLRHPGHLHPLLRWFRTTQDPTAMSLGRVPTVVSPAHLREALYDELRPVGIEQHLSIPCSSQRTPSRAFVLATTGRDFSDRQLELARRIQPLLLLLARRVDAAGVTFSAAATRVGLTPRESRVLEKIVEGATSRQIGEDLSISPRTVETHIGAVYRKLGVHDRLSALRTAEALGLVAAARRTGTTPVQVQD